MVAFDAMTLGVVGAAELRDLRPANVPRLLEHRGNLWVRNEALPALSARRASSAVTLATSSRGRCAANSLRGGRQPEQCGEMTVGPPDVTFSGR
jgi:hypothetical protein